MATKLNTSEVTMVGLSRMWDEVRSDVLNAVDRVGDRGWFILGPEVERFESEFARTIGVAAVVACASGTDAIELALRAAGLQTGQRVATTPLSAYATTTGIVRAGGVPVYFDTDSNGNVNLEHVANWAESRSERSFSVPVHLYGNPLDPDKLSKLSAIGVVVVEDCAQAFGASWGGLEVGGSGVAAAYSLYPTKNVGAFGDAGAIATSQFEMGDRLFSLREYGQTEPYVNSEYGINSRMDSIQGAILVDAILPRSVHWVRRRTEVARRYLQGIDHPSLRCLEPGSPANAAWHLFPVFVDEGSPQAFRAWLQKLEIQTGLHYPTLIPDQEATKSFDHEVVGELDSARSLANSEVSLPMHPYLSDVDVDRVIEAVNTWRQ